VIDPKAYRARQIKDLTDQIGVYALCDLDGVPIYVGQSVDGIRSRVRRHLTSARSDIIANRIRQGVARRRPKRHSRARGLSIRNIRRPEPADEWQGHDQRH
jgi:hypothetical protein